MFAGTADAVSPSPARGMIMSLAPVDGDTGLSVPSAVANACLPVDRSVPTMA